MYVCLGHTSMCSRNCAMILHDGHTCLDFNLAFHWPRSIEYSSAHELSSTSLNPEVCPVLCAANIMPPSYLVLTSEFIAAPPGYGEIGRDKS